MARNIDRFVAENRERIRDVDSRFVEVDSNRDRDLSFGPSFIEVGVAADVYRRTTGSQVVFGHADASKGFGRGTFGDDKGGWEHVADVGVDRVVFTRDGRRAVAQALDGQDGAVTTSKAGTGSDDPVTSDADLTDVYAVTRTANGKPEPNAVESRGVHDAASWVGDPTEFGIFDDEDRLLARVVVDDPDDVFTDDEVRVDVVLTFEGEGVGNSVITDVGEESIADATAFPYEATGPVEFAFGSGTEQFDKGDTSLTDPKFSKACERLLDRGRVTARTHIFEGEPDTQPVEVGEMGVFDTEDRMIWATTVRSFTKREGAGVNAESEFRIS